MLLVTLFSMIAFGGLGWHIHGGMQRSFEARQQHPDWHWVLGWNPQTQHDAMLVRCMLVLLVHDNGQPNLARVCRQFLEAEGIDTTDCAPHLPDLNPKEHLRVIMFRSSCQVVPQLLNYYNESLAEWTSLMPQLFNLIFRVSLNSALRRLILFIPIKRSFCS